MRPSVLKPHHNIEQAPCQVHLGPGEVIWAEIIDTARTTNGMTIFYLRVTTRLQILEHDKATFYVVTAISVFRQSPVRGVRGGAP